MAYTKEQKLFIKGQAKLKKLDQIKEENGEWTVAEKQLRDEIVVVLLKTVLKYGMGLAKQKLYKYNLPSDAYQDVEMDLMNVFMDELPKYDPRRVTPTTFFKHYFEQEIYKYATKYSQNLTPYDSKNVGMVRAAIKYLESRNMDVTEELISQLTGLSEKVVRKTLVIANNSTRANIEDAYGVQSDHGLPEKEVVQADTLNVLIMQLKEILSEDDYEFFMASFNNFEGSSNMTFAELADKYMDGNIRNTKQRYSNIVQSLRESPVIQSIAGKGKSRKSGGLQLSFNDMSGDITQSSILAAVNNDK